MAKYYIVQWTNWESGNHHPVDGPFSSRPKATEILHQFKDSSPTVYGGINIAGQIHADVFSRHWLSANGYPNTPDGDAQLAEDLATYGEEWVERLERNIEAEIEAEEIKAAANTPNWFPGTFPK